MEIAIVDRVCHQAIERLFAAGIETAQIEVQCLKEKFLDTEHEDVEGFLDAIANREKRIPLGYILGYAYFDGLKLQVASGTFVPREQSLPLIEDICIRAKLLDVHKITDICAGVGPLGISLSRRLTCNSVCFIEYNEKAAKILRENIRTFVPENYNVVISNDDIFSTHLPEKRCGNSQIVVANPPFVPAGRASMPEFSVHHPSDAIFSGSDGTDAVKRCCVLASQFLTEGGILGVEHHESHVSLIDMLLGRLGFIDVRHFPDGDGKMRITTATLGMSSKR